MLTLLTAVLTALLGLLLAGCDVDMPDHPDGLEAITNGEQYMALGNSLTAGVMDGGLMMPGQLGSFPMHVATQMGLDVTPGSGEFQQPLINAPGIGGREGDQIIGNMYFNGSGIGILGSTHEDLVLSQLLAAATIPTPYENLGVPGALLSDVMNAYNAETSFGAPFGQPNPFFDFINRATFFGDPGNDVLALQPTMMNAAIAKGARVATLWIGNNDVLGGATRGTPVPGVTMTSVADFTSQYTTTLMTLARGLVQRNGFPSYIVVGNIPSISDIPYFMPKALFEASFDAASPVPWANTMGYAEGDNDDGMLVRLPALSEAGPIMLDPDNPQALPGEYTLTSAEVAAIATTVEGYNTVITNAVAAVNDLFPGTCAIFDANTMLTEASAEHMTQHFLHILPTVAGDVEMAATRTYFSLDGIHLNNMGYARVANGFLEKINELMDTNYPMVDVAAQVWDPTYGRTPLALANGPLVSPEAAKVLHNIVR